METIYSSPVWRFREYEMCDNVISAMLQFSGRSWEAVIESIDVITRPVFSCELISTKYPQYRPSRARNKHVILALYALGRDFARAQRWQKVFGFFYVDLDCIGLVGIQQTPSETLGNVKSASENGHSRIGQNSTLADVTGVFTDPDDTNFQIHYTRHMGESIDRVDVFLTFIDALANAISHDASATRARVNSTNDLPSALRLQIRSAKRNWRPILRWGQCVRAIGLLWTSLTGAYGFFDALTFSIEYAGEKIGFGSLREDGPAGGGGTISSDKRSSF